MKLLTVLVMFALQRDNNILKYQNQRTDKNISETPRADSALTTLNYFVGKTEIDVAVSNRLTVV